MHPSEPVSTQVVTENIGLLLSLASAQGVAAANAVLRPLELSSRSFSLLEVVAHADGASQRELADAIRLDPSQIVTLLDTLERRGLLERRPNPHDRRQRLVVITARGRTLLEEASGLVERSLDDVLADLAGSERETLRDLLHRVVHRQLNHVS
ncbi:MarR family winged helix-turn-helix transcriptional regulator [Georgenia sp. SYP-B2076]|uniref:MarR family winged helix-turn-helix transcriptional regulator n=1 Tax=Georgenia sp. SYP-B2076 TaxID=2495881 RepID=UPI000F8F5BB3|nr:MarR family transcriptional regulator [Georgenia sp. SYP-B2076]